MVGVLVGVLVVLGAFGWALSREWVLGIPVRWGTFIGLAEQGADSSSSLQAFGFRDFRGLGLPSEQGANATPQVGKNESGVLGELGSVGPGGIGAPGVRMPDDIRRWLEHLKRVDLRREEANSQLAARYMTLVVSLMPGMFGDIEEAEADDQKRRAKAQEVFREVDDLFGSIQKDFHSLPPPPVCKPIAEEYGAVLENTRAMVLDLMEAVALVDMEKALSLQNKSYTRIDARVVTCNALVEALCEKYREPNRYRLFVDKPSSVALPSAQILENYRRLLESLTGVDKG